MVITICFSSMHGEKQIIASIEFGYVLFLKLHVIKNKLFNQTNPIIILMLLTFVGSEHQSLRRHWSNQLEHTLLKVQSTHNTGPGSDKRIRCHKYAGKLLPPSQRTDHALYLLLLL